MDDFQLDTALGRVRVRIRGSGEAMLFWPSLLMTGDMWAAQAEHFGRRHQVILVDPPGHGRSDPLTATFTFAECARCIADLLDALGLVESPRRRQLMGRHDRRHVRRRLPRPDRCGSTDELHRVGRRYTPTPRVRRVAARRPPAGQDPAAADPFGAQGVPGADDVRYPPGGGRRCATSVEAVDITSAAWAVRSVVPQRPDQRALLSAVRTPVLVVAGTEDATFPLSETIVMADAIPGAAIAVLEGVAHLAALENPPLVNTLIGEFVLLA